MTDETPRVDEAAGTGSAAEEPCDGVCQSCEAFGTLRAEMTPHQFRVLAKCDDGTWAVQDSVDLDDMIRVLALAETFSRYARNVKTMVTKHFLMKAARFKCDRECPHDAGTAGGVEADAGDQVGPADSIDLQVSELVRTTIEEMNAKLLSIGICAKIDVVTIPVPRG